MLDPNEWARNVDTAITTRRVEEARRNSEFTARREFIKSRAPALWEDLQESFKVLCTAFNARGKMTLVPTRSGPDLLLIKRDGGVETLTVVHDPNTHEVSVRPGRKYRPTIIPVGDGQIALSAVGQMFSCEDVAKESLEGFIRLVG